ncbi:MAG: hypothetical protein JXD22_08645 [Sedimentisphaerales bacterium]|nr:hypothetical protein [Sedimentisphaerales bacterium]
MALLSGVMVGAVWAGPFAEHGVTPDAAVAWASFVVEAQGQSPATNILGPVDANWAIGYPAGGSITVGFDYPIYNGAGPDFAVWENAFSVTGGGGTIFAELGYVDVSTDGENWVTFPSVYLDDHDEYTNIEPNNVYNLAGNYIGHYVPLDQREGTGFDLEDLLNTAEVVAGLVDPNIINFVRIRDIISPPAGGNNFDQATYFFCEQCSENHRISDGNANTELGGGGGADWDAVGIINVLSADFDKSGKVNLADLYILAQSWMSIDDGSGWDGRCDISDPNDGAINYRDFVNFAEQWLKP